MDLWIYLAAFYVWQWTVQLPPGAAIFAPALGGPRVARGPGLRLRLPWPGAVSLALGGWPFDLSAERAWAGTPLPEGRDLAAQSLSFAEARSLELRGVKLHGPRGFFLRAVSAAHAAHLAKLLGELGGAAPDDRRERVVQALEAAVDVARFRATLDAARSSTRLLRWLCSAYTALLFVGVPPVVLLLGQDGGWLFLLPGLVTLHVACLVTLVFAERWLAKPAGRLERLFIAALFPPALLVAPVDLVNAALVGFHPAVAAVALLSRDEALRFLAREVAEVEIPPWRRDSCVPCPEAEARERHLREVGRVLRGLAHELAIAPDRVLEPPAPTQPDAASRCPLCLDDFRSGFVRCARCGVPTRRYAQR